MITHCDRDAVSAVSWQPFGFRLHIFALPLSIWMMYQYSEGSYNEVNMVDSIHDHATEINILMKMIYYMWVSV